MRRWLTLVAILAAAPGWASPRLLVQAGVGFPELVHAEVGLFVTDRISLELQAGNIVFNSMVGLGATGWLLGDAAGRPPRHALLVSAQSRFNPTVSPLRLTSGGETLGALLGGYVGYGFLTEVGFTLRFLAGLVASWEGGPALGPNATLSLGWVW